MFAVLTEVAAKKRGAFAVRRARKKGVSPKIIQARAGATRYFVIESESGHFGRNWELIRAAAGDAADRLLITENIPVPPEIKRYKPDAFLSCLMQNAAVAALRAAIIPSQLLKIAVYDRYGDCVPLCGALLALTDHVTVVTQRVDVYTHYAFELLNTLGAMPVVTKDVYDFDQACVAVAPFGLCGFPPLSNALLFSRGGETGALSIGKGCFTLPRQYQNHVPQGISAVVFGGALYEFGNAFELSKIIPDGFLYNGAMIPIRQIVKMIREKAVL